MNSSLLNFISLLIIGFITSFLIIKVYKEYKLTKTLDEKILFWIAIIVAFVPLILFYLDTYNVASRLNWVNANNINRWFNFIATYVSSIVGATIGAITLFLMTTKQINLQRESNKEDKRIQNLPLLAYEFSKNKITDNYCEVFLRDNYKKIYYCYNLFLNVMNLGLNHATNVSLKVYDNDKLVSDYPLSYNQSIIKKDESLYIDFIFYFNYKNNRVNIKNFKIICNYTDLLNNNYLQEIYISLELCNTFKSTFGGFDFNILKVEVSNPIQIHDTTIK